MNVCDYIIHIVQKNIPPLIDLCYLSLTSVYIHNVILSKGRLHTVETDEFGCLNVLFLQRKGVTIRRAKK